MEAPRPNTSQLGSPVSVNERKPISIDDCKRRLRDHLKQEASERRRDGSDEVSDLNDLYDNESLNECAGRAAKMIEALHKDGCGRETSKSLSLLTLYDMAVLIDDSASMTPSRVKVLKDAMIPIAHIYQLANPNGISSLCFLNDHRSYKDVDETRVQQILSSIGWWGNSRIAWALRRKVLEPLVWNKGGSRDTTINRMVLVLIVTDGQVEGEDPKNLKDLIDYTLGGLPQRGGAGAVAFQFARIGMDNGPNTFLSELDRQTGKHVDSVPLDERLQGIDEEKRTENYWDTWLKILCGAIVDTINQQDMRGEDDDGDEEVGPSEN